MTEQAIQKKRANQLEKEGYFVIKLINTNVNGIPDLLAIHPEKGVLFSEIKKPNRVLSDLQKYRLKQLKEYGCRTEVYRG